MKQEDMDQILHMIMINKNILSSNLERELCFWSNYDLLQWRFEYLPSINVVWHCHNGNINRCLFGNFMHCFKVDSVRVAADQVVVSLYRMFFSLKVWVSCTTSSSTTCTRCWERGLWWGVAPLRFQRRFRTTSRPGGTGLSGSHWCSHFLPRSVKELKDLWWSLSTLCDIVV